MQVLHLVLGALDRRRRLGAAIQKAQQRRALEARVAHTVHAHAEAVAPRAVGALQVKRTHTQAFDALGHLGGRLHLHAPLRQPYRVRPATLRRRGVLAARQLDARLALRTVHQVIARAHLHDVTGFHHGDAVAEAQRFVDVVRHVQDGAAERVEQADQVLLQNAFQVRIERGERLVEHEDARARREHASKRHALLLAAGELHGIALLEARQAEALELGLHHGVAVGRRHVLGDARRHVLRHGQVGEQHVVLEQQGRFALLRR